MEVLTLRWLLNIVEAAASRFFLIGRERPETSEEQMDQLKNVEWSVRLLLALRCISQHFSEKFSVFISCNVPDFYVHVFHFGVDLNLVFF